MLSFFRKKIKPKHICPIIEELQKEGKFLQASVYCNKEDIRALRPFLTPCCVKGECLVNRDAIGPRVHNYTHIVPYCEIKEHIRKFYVHYYEVNENMFKRYLHLFLLSIEGVAAYFSLVVKKRFSCVFK